MRPIRGVRKLLAIAALFGAVPAGAESARPADSDVTGWVEEAIAADPRVRGDEIVVSVEKGIVTLSGSAPTLATRKYAVMATSKIYGVLAVIDQLEMDVAARPDAELAADVRWKIERSPAIRSDDLEVSARGGLVILRGTIPSWSQRHEAELLASEVRGVRQIENHLSPQTGTSRKDTDIERDLIAALRRDIYLSRLPVRATVEDGVATLRGAVGSAYERSRAGNLSRWIDGVRGVRNHLEVEWSHEPAAPRIGSAPPSDEELTERVTAQLGQETRIDSSRVHVTVAKGRVTLHGVVPSLRERRIAEEDTWNVVGVGWVSNELRVAGAARRDAEMEQEILRALAADSELFDAGVTIEITEGVARLRGLVASGYQRTHAGAIAARTRGIQRVENHLRVTAWADRRDGDLAEQVRLGLARDWKMAGLGGRIRVLAESGVVTLTGAVDTWSERRSAGRIAASTPGVRRVLNRLVVKPYPYLWEERDEDSEGPPPWDPYYFDYPALPWIAGIERARGTSPSTS